MYDKELFIREVEDTLKKGEGTVIEPAYTKLVVDTLTELATNDEELNRDLLVEISNLLDAVVERALNTTDQMKVASMLMARLSYAKYLTIAHVNIILTTIGLTFKHGNQILYNISKYNSHINNICLEKMNILYQLSDTRRKAVNDEDKKKEDLDNVEAIIKQQFATL